MRFVDPARATMRLDRVSALGAAVGRPELADVMSQKFVQLCIRFAGTIQPLQERGLDKLAETLPRLIDRLGQIDALRMDWLAQAGLGSP